MGAGEELSESRSLRIVIGLAFPPRCIDPCLDFRAEFPRTRTARAGCYGRDAVRCFLVILALLLGDILVSALLGSLSSVLVVLVTVAAVLMTAVPCRREARGDMPHY